MLYLPYVSPYEGTDRYGSQKLLLKNKPGNKLASQENTDTINTDSEKLSIHIKAR